eukprot:m.138174 g.138174  ORF g.138174 m.138174 type:complete len:236 (-) comp29974_c0_seq1:100-807(-)
MSTWCENPSLPRPRLVMPATEVNRRLWERRVFNEYIKQEGLPLEIKASPHGGDGLFVTKDFKAHSKVCDFLGSIVHGQDLKDSRNAVSLLPCTDAVVVNDQELTHAEARLVINSVPGLSFKSATSTVAFADTISDLILDPSGWINPAQKANDAAYRKHIHKNTYCDTQYTQNTANLWHCITKTEATAAHGDYVVHDYRISVEIRSLREMKAGDEVCVPYGSSYWFHRKGCKLTCL